MQPWWIWLFFKNIKKLIITNLWPIVTTLQVSRLQNHLRQASCHLYFHSQWCERVCWCQWSRFPKIEEGEVIIKCSWSHLLPWLKSAWSFLSLLSVLQFICSPFPLLFIWRRKKTLQYGNFLILLLDPVGCWMLYFMKPSNYYVSLQEGLKEKWLWGILEGLFLFPLYICFLILKVHMLFALFV